jgi:putative radical SAM enzyme (TIGR03279 family)
MKKYKNQVEENEGFRIDRNAAGRDLGDREGFTRGVAITEIEPDSVADELGLQVGDQLLEIDGVRARDVLQLKKADLGEKMTLTIASGDTITQYDIEKDITESLGLGFDAELFDGVKRCTNKCPFCFVDQLPPRVKGEANLRRTLYIRDDDYRLSFLHGHYITLTNLKDEDYARIIEEKLTPLCVSVHATDPATRIRLVGNPSGGQIIERLKFLIANGITVNTQIVLSPEINDGKILDQSIEDLMDLYPGVESMAVVPTGLTKFMPAERGLRTVRPEEAAAILDQIEPYQKEARKRFGVKFVYGSDEMYLLAGRPMPRASFYDGYPQFANGVGTIRAFLDEVAKVRRRKMKVGRAPKVTLVTGGLAAPVLRELADALRERNLADASVAEIKNTYWGGNVACAGLIMGSELLTQLKGQDLGEMVFLPPDAIDNQKRTLDDITVETLARQWGTEVRHDAHGPADLANFFGRAVASAYEGLQIVRQ